MNIKKSFFLPLVLLSFLLFPKVLLAISGLDGIAFPLIRHAENDFFIDAIERDKESRRELQGYFEEKVPEGFILLDDYYGERFRKTKKRIKKARNTLAKESGYEVSKKKRFVRMRNDLSSENTDLVDKVKKKNFSKETSRLDDVDPVVGSKPTGEATLTNGVAKAPKGGKNEGSASGSDSSSESSGESASALPSQDSQPVSGASASDEERVARIRKRVARIKADSGGDRKENLESVPDPDVDLMSLSLSSDRELAGAAMDAISSVESTERMREKVAGIKKRLAAIQRSSSEPSPVLIDTQSGSSLEAAATDAAPEASAATATSDELELSAEDILAQHFSYIEKETKEYVEALDILSILLATKLVGLEDFTDDGAVKEAAKKMVIGGVIAELVKDFRSKDPGGGRLKELVDFENAIKFLEEAKGEFFGYVKRSDYPVEKKKALAFKMFRIHWLLAKAFPVVKRELGEIKTEAADSEGEGESGSDGGVDDTAIASDFFSEENFVDLDRQMKGAAEKRAFAFFIYMYGLMLADKYEKYSRGEVFVETEGFVRANNMLTKFFIEQRYPQGFNRHKIP